MKTAHDVLEINLNQLNDIYQQGSLENVKVIGAAMRRWYFTFESIHPVTGEPQTFTLIARRHGRREWSDPRRLLAWLNDNYGVTDGTFHLSHLRESS